MPPTAKSEHTGGAVDEGGTAAPFTYAPGRPGPAYFAVRDEGVVMLEGGELTRVEGSPPALVREILQGRDGGMYLLGVEGVMRLEGPAIRLVAATSAEAPVGTLTDFAVDRDGTIWGVGWKGVVFWSGSAWTIEEGRMHGADVSLHGVTLDGGSRVWVASTNALHVRQDGAWSTVDLSEHWATPPAFDGVRTGPRGAVLALATDGLLEAIAPDELRRVVLGDDLLLETLGSSPAGVLGLRANVDEVVRIDRDGQQRRWRAKQDFAASDIADVTPDDAGRLWVATDAGVVVLGPGDERVEWRSGSVRELAGTVEVIGVAGAGPVLPSAVGPVQTGGLVGTIVHDGKPIARAKLELCPRPRRRFEVSPCAEAPTRASTTTDADGRFALEDVPLGAYGIAVKAGATWMYTVGVEQRVREPGRAHDAGKVEVHARKGRARDAGTNDEP